MQGGTHNDPPGGAGAGGLSGGSSGGGYGGSGGGTGGIGGGADSDFASGASPGTGAGGSTDGGYGGSTGGLGGSTGGLGGSSGGLGGSTGGLGGSSGGYGASGSGAGDIGGGAESDFATAEPVYRRDYDALTAGTAGSVAYEEARGGYELGHTAASNPAYAERTYEEVEPEIQRDYGDTGRFERVREYARSAFEWKRVLAGVALVAGGYWVGKKLYNAASDLNEEDEQDCRTYYETHTARSSGVPYRQARTVYVLGYVAGRNPEYSGRTYDDVEPHLRGGFTGSRGASYDSLRDFGRRGYERGSTRGSV